MFYALSVTGVNMGVVDGKQDQKFSVTLGDMVSYVYNIERGVVV